LILNARSHFYVILTEWS